MIDKLTMFFEQKLSGPMEDICVQFEMVLWQLCH